MLQQFLLLCFSISSGRREVKKCLEYANKIFKIPEVENISSALQGGNALKDPDLPLKNFNGFAIYSQWEMTDEKWKEWDRVNNP